MSADLVSGFAAGVSFTLAYIYVFEPWFSQKLAAYGRAHGWR